MNFCKVLSGFASIKIVSIIGNLIEIAFPANCLCCGHPLTRSSDLICPFCYHDLFADANPDGMLSCNGVILPDDIQFQDALWLYDKNGSMQEVLHLIKYQGMGNLAVEIGRKLGIRATLRSEIWDIKQPVLVPVPLHPRRLRVRGFNQAECIAQGVHEETGWRIIPPGDVIRTRNTKTQTGFNAMARSENVRNVFHVNSDSHLRSREVVIVDDVYTTGATTRELAQTLKRSGARKIGVLTIVLA